MKTETEKLVDEMMTLRAACEAHHALEIAAGMAYDEACEFAAIPTKYGRYTVDLSKESWRYPGVEAASRAYEALRQDSGYFWACSRLSDLETLLGAGWGTKQLPIRIGMFVPALGGDIPEANEVVSEFITRFS